MAVDQGVLAHLVAEKCTQMPDNKVLTFVNEREDLVDTRTFAELMANAQALASFMVSKGMSKGERFAVLLQNHAAVVEALVAASIGGFVVVPVDPRNKGDKLKFMLSDSGCHGIICASYSQDEAAVAADETKLNWRVSVSDPSATPSSSMLSYSDVLEAFAGQTLEIQCTSGKDPLQVLYTSGTTGDPKGIVKPNARFAEVGGGIPGVLGLGEGDRLYTGLSLTHANAQFFTLAIALATGLPAVFSQRFTKSRMWETIRKYNCTYFTLLGGMSNAIFSVPERPDDTDNPVGLVLSAGMPEAIWRDFEERFGLRLFEAYGAAEGGMFWNDGSGPAGSFGHLTTNPIYEARIVDENDDDCASGQQGELIWRPRTGDKVQVEYLGKDDASRVKTRGGWFRTGDVIHTNDDGWMFFDYRKGGGIRRNGDFINPGFVEKVVAASDQVIDVFVYGVPIAGGTPGEKDVVAAIVVDPSATFDPAEIFANCKQNLETNFIPSFLHVLDEIPKTASEKPQERFLLDAFSADAPNVYTMN